MVILLGLYSNVALRGFVFVDFVHLFSCTKITFCLSSRNRDVHCPTSPPNIAKLHPVFGVSNTQPKQLPIPLRGVIATYPIGALYLSILLIYTTLQVNNVFSVLPQRVDPTLYQLHAVLDRVCVCAKPHAHLRGVEKRPRCSCFPVKGFPQRARYLPVRL